jgi:Ca2+-binding EF-hand superfamily protein
MTRLSSHRPGTILTAVVLVPLFLLGVATASTAVAADEKAAPPGGSKRDRMVNKFDKDGDGRLSTEERQAARDAWQQKSFDTDGDGVLSPAEQEAAKQAQAKTLEKYDRDGDGQLSQDERRAMWKSQREAYLDTDGDGTVSDEERQAGAELRRQRQAEALEKYDVDGDGKLSPSEREAAAKEGHWGVGGKGRRHGGMGDGGGAAQKSPTESE